MRDPLLYYSILRSTSVARSYSAPTDRKGRRNNPHEKRYPKSVTGNTIRPARPIPTDRNTAAVNAVRKQALRCLLPAGAYLPCAPFGKQKGGPVYHGPPKKLCERPPEAYMRNEKPPVKLTSASAGFQLTAVKMANSSPGSPLTGQLRSALRKRSCT